jgi:hypothetical protein
METRRLGVIGDVHAEHRRLDAALNFLSSAGVDAICCTGDVADGPGCVDTCCALLASANVLTVGGRYVCGDPKSVMPVWAQPNGPLNYRQIEEINDLETQKQRFIARMQVIEKLQRSRSEVVHLFDEVAKTMPDGTYLTSFTQEGKKPSIKEDLKLYDRLVGSHPLHASPCEHQATPDSGGGVKGRDEHRWGNFWGWVQYRKTLPGECQ